jgi:hypothetical protein
MRCTLLDFGCLSTTVFVDSSMPSCGLVMIKPNNESFTADSAVLINLGVTLIFGSPFMLWIFFYRQILICKILKYV